MKNWGKIFLFCLALTACSSDKKMAPTQGRMSITEQNQLFLSSEKPFLDSSKSVAFEYSLNAQNKIPHLKVSSSDMGWHTDMDEEIDEKFLPFAHVFVGEKQLYALDGDFNFFVFDLKGKMLLNKNLSKEQPLAFVFKNDTFVATSPKGQVIAFDKKGKVLWQKNYQVPFRNSPVFYKDYLYLLSATNDLWVLNAQNGQEVWHYKTTMPATTWWQMASPAANNNVVVVPFSNGLVSAFHAQEGSFLWEEDMSGAKAFNQFDQMTQMIASPVIEDNIVYLVGHADITKALDLKTGEKLWEVSIGGQTTPVINGNMLFILDNHNTLYALNKKSGKLFWKEDIPVLGESSLRLVNGDLFVFSKNQGIKINIKTGKVIQQISFEEELSFPTITKNGFYFITQDGKVLYKGQLK